MATLVTIPPQFRKKLDRYACKSRSVVLEVESLIGILENDERPGDKIPNVGYDVYKVRLKNPSAKKGKSKGFRAGLAHQSACLSLMRQPCYNTVCLANC